MKIIQRNRVEYLVCTFHHAMPLKKTSRKNAACIQFFARWNKATEWRVDEARKRERGAEASPFRHPMFYFSYLQNMFCLSPMRFFHVLFASCGRFCRHLSCSFDQVRNAWWEAHKITLGLFHNFPVFRFPHRICFTVFFFLSHLFLFIIMKLWCSSHRSAIVGFVRMLVLSPHIAWRTTKIYI